MHFREIDEISRSTDVESLAPMLSISSENDDLVWESDPLESILLSKYAAPVVSRVSWREPAPMCTPTL